MIPANELRKGVIIIDYSGHVREVTGEDIQSQCWHEEGQTGTTEAPLNPIPLTPEWLERCGFKWHSLPDSEGNEHNVYTTKWGDFDLTMFDNDILELESVRMPHIKHLHQLQNLYFALTGEELKIEL
jgi:hypothetical protein